MRKKILVSSVLLIFVSITFVGCGNIGDKLDITSSINNMKDNDNEENESEDEDLIKTEEENIKISNATVFSDGLAWVKTEGGKWQCIDKKGKKQFELDCQSVSNFINGYSVIDNSIIINSKGKEVFNFENEGYTLYSSEPFDVDYAVLTKEIDTYDKSGTFYYTLNLKTNEIVEIDFSNCSFLTFNGWADFYKSENSGGYTVMPCEYLGNGYFSLQIVSDVDIYTGDIGRSSNFSMIQWYDIKNNNYINIDTGIEYGEKDLPDTILYYDTPDDNILCAYIVNENKILFIDTELCEIKNTVEGEIHCYGYAYNLVGVYENDYMLICYDDNDDRWFLDMETEEKFQMTTEYEEDEYEILCYKDGYFGIDLVNDIGTHYFAVVSKNGSTVFEPTAYDSECLFTPCFLGNNVIFYDGTKMCFVSTENWQIDNQREMQLSIVEDSDDSNKKKSSAFIIKLDESNDNGILANHNTSSYSYYKSDGTIIEENSNTYLYNKGYNFSDDYILIYNNSTGSYGYVDCNFEELNLNLK